MAASKLTAKTLEAAKPSEHAYRIRYGIPLSPDSSTQSPHPAGSKSFAFQYSSPERKGGRFYPSGVYKTAGQSGEDIPLTHHWKNPQRHPATARDCHRRH